MRSRNLLLITAIFFSLSAGTVSAQYITVGNVKSIEQQVEKKLNTLPYYGVFDHITFQVNGDTVVLNGKVSSGGTRPQAESAVKRIPGVVNVINNIEQLPASSYDDSIRTRTLQAFADRGMYRYFYELEPEVRIIVEGGRVTLEGRVANRGDYNTLNVLANSVSGVFSVTNNLTIEYGVG
jgi:hyperosmotically inducible periplasmic protein